MDVECPFTSENKLMGVSSGVLFLALFAMMDRLGLIISCVPVCAREMELGLELGLGGVQPGGHYRGVDILLCGSVPDCVDYFPRST